MRGIDYPYTHDIRTLHELLDDSGGAPEHRDDAVALTPWAAEFRYGDVVSGTLDRSDALTVAGRILAWAEREVAGRAAARPQPPEEPDP